MKKTLLGLTLALSTAVSAHAVTTKISLKSARIVSIEQCQARLQTSETNVLAQIPLDLCSKLSIGDELSNLELSVVPTVAPPEVEFSGDLHLVKAQSKKLGALTTAQ